MLNKPRVADVMTKDVTTVYEETNLQQVFALFSPYTYRHLPVVDGKRLVGIISQRDLLQVQGERVSKNPALRAHAERTLEETFVRDIMNTNVVTIRPDASLAQAAQHMLEHRVGALPVIDDRNQLLGIVTETDLLRSLSHML